MSKRVTIIFDNATYDWLTAESERTSVSFCQLVRRAVHRTYSIEGRRTTGVEIRLGIWRRRIFGQRSGVPLDR